MIDQYMHLNEEFFDLNVTANISKLRFMFSLKHMDTVMNLLRVVTDQHEHPSNLHSSSTNKEKELVVPNVEDFFSFLYRVKLDVTVNAPIIIIPDGSGDRNAILLDCGLIKVQTSLEILDKYYEMINIKIDEKKLNDRCKIPPVIEIQHVTLSNMEILK